MAQKPKANPFDAFLSEAREEGYGQARKSQPDGIYSITGLTFDSSVTDKNGKKTVVLETPDGQIRLYQNSHDRTIAVLSAIIRDGGTPMIGYFHEARETGTGTWVRTRAGDDSNQESMSKLHAWFKERPGSRASRATTTANTEAKADAPAKVESEDAPF